MGSFDFQRQLALGEKFEQSFIAAVPQIWTGAHAEKSQIVGNGSHDLDLTRGNVRHSAELKFEGEYPLMNSGNWFIEFATATGDVPKGDAVAAFRAFKRRADFANGVKLAGYRYSLGLSVQRWIHAQPRVTPWDVADWTALYAPMGEFAQAVDAAIENVPDGKAVAVRQSSRRWTTFGVPVPRGAIIGNLAGSASWIACRGSAVTTSPISSPPR